MWNGKDAQVTWDYYKGARRNVRKKLTRLYWPRQTVGLGLVIANHVNCPQSTVRSIKKSTAMQWVWVNVFSWFLSTCAFSLTSERNRLNILKMWIFVAHPSCMPEAGQPGDLLQGRQWFLESITQANANILPGRPKYWITCDKITSISFPVVKYLVSLFSF